MIRVIIETLLGSAGTQVLQFYEQYSLIINSIVVLYGAILLLSWVTHLRIYRHLAVLVAKGIHEDATLNRKSKLRLIKEKVEIPWKEAIDAAPFPLIAQQGSLVPRRKSVANMKLLTNDDELISHGRDVLRGTHPKRVKPDFFGRFNDPEIDEEKKSTEPTD
jgi:hypothetical protein